MTYTTSIMNTEATQCDLPGIEDIVQNIWSLVKVANDKHAVWGISHWRDQCKSFYRYARGLECTHDVYSTKRIMAVTRVEVMRKHGYRYLREIEVRRADNDLYTFKEGEFLRLHINDIEDIMILIVQSRLTNLLEVFVTQQDENVIYKEVDVAQVQVTTVATTSTISINEATLAQALIELKHAKPKTKAKGIVFHEPEESTTTTIPKPKSQVKEKSKAKMIEESVKLKKKDQI
nr:hypothetical protein [Tanacetum cinerariifolium]